MKITHFLPAFGWFFLSLILLCIPGSTIPRFPWLSILHGDKWIHLLLFFILCFLFSWPFSKTSLDRHNRKKYFILITVTGVAYGTIMEFVQKYYVVNRSFELWDIMADIMGCFLAYWYSLTFFVTRKGT